MAPSRVPPPLPSKQANADLSVVKVVRRSSRSTAAVVPVVPVSDNDDDEDYDHRDAVVTPPGSPVVTTAASPTGTSNMTAKKPAARPVKLKPGQQTAFVANPGHPGVAPDKYDVTLGGLLAAEGNGLPLLTSITVGIRGQHCRSNFQPLTFQALSVLSSCAAACLETGKRKGHAHVQAAALFHVEDSFEEALLAIANALKQWCGIEHGSGGIVQVKMAVGNQTKAGLIGYVHKLPLKADMWNITEAELEAAKEEYALVSTDPLKGKRTLNKSNFVKEVFAYAKHNFASDLPEIDVAALQAVRSGEYAPTSIWIGGSGGSGLDLVRAKIYWRVCNDPEATTLQDIHSIFFHDPYRKRPLPMPARVPSFHSMQQRAQAQAAANTQHHYAKTNVVLAEPADPTEPGAHHHLLHFDDASSSESHEEEPAPKRKCIFADDEASDDDE